VLPLNVAGPDIKLKLTGSPEVAVAFTSKAGSKVNLLSISGKSIA